MKREKSELLRLQKEQRELIDRIQRLHDDIENLNDRFIALLESDLNVCPWCRPVDIGGYHAVALSQLEHAQHYMELAREAMFIPEGGEVIPLSSN